MFDHQSLVNVTLEIRTEFHGDRLVRFRDILHTVSKNLVSRDSFVIFSHVPFTYNSQFLQFTTKLNPSPLTLDSPNVIFESHDLHLIILLKVVNGDTNSIILQLFIIVLQNMSFQRLGPFVSNTEKNRFFFFFENFKLSRPL